MVAGTITAYGCGSAPGFDRLPCGTGVGSSAAYRRDDANLLLGGEAHRAVDLAAVLEQVDLTDALVDELTPDLAQPALRVALGREVAGPLARIGRCALGGLEPPRP